MEVEKGKMDFSSSLFVLLYFCLISSLPLGNICHHILLCCHPAENLMSQTMVHFSVIVRRKCPAVAWNGQSLSRISTVQFITPLIWSSSFPSSSSILETACPLYNLDLVQCLLIYRDGEPKQVAKGELAFFSFIIPTSRLHPSSLLFSLSISG